VIGADEFAFLNAVYLKKMATADAIAAITSLPLATVEDMAAKFAATEDIFALPVGIMLMPAGTEFVLEYYRETYATVRADPQLSEWYDRFEHLNQRFIALISDWQRSGNDPGTLDKAIKVVERLNNAIEDLLPTIPRYEEFVRRFNEAIDRVDSGDLEFVSNPTKDSIHNVWFEFHEDILAVLGRPRDTT
jgi:hypothetical protein